jgi:hypothetical protein
MFRFNLNIGFKEAVTVIPIVNSSYPKITFPLSLASPAYLKYLRASIFEEYEYSEHRHHCPR